MGDLISGIFDRDPEIPCDSCGQKGGSAYPMKLREQTFLICFECHLFECHLKEIRRLMLAAEDVIELLYEELEG